MGAALRLLKPGPYTEGMSKYVAQLFWGLLLLAGLLWAAILLFPGTPLISWLSLRLVVAQAIAFPGILSLISSGFLLLALFTLFRRKVSRVTRVLAGGTALVMALASCTAFFDPYGAKRYQARGAPTASCTDATEYTVITYNALDTLTEQDLAELLEQDPDFLILPEVSPETPALAGGVAGYQVFASTSTAEYVAPTLTLVNERLGNYSASGVPMTFGALLLKPLEGTGPSLLAVHTAPPIPTYMSRWREDLATIEVAATVGQVDLIAGDFNATLLHGSLASYAGLGSSYGKDAALSADAVEGTWPVSGALNRFGFRAPIDHVVINQPDPARALSVQSRVIGASDHAALIAQVALCPGK